MSEAYRVVPSMYACRGEQGKLPVRRRLTTACTSCERVRVCACVRACERRASPRAGASGVAASALRPSLVQSPPTGPASCDVANAVHGGLLASEVRA